MLYINCLCFIFKNPNKLTSKTMKNNLNLLRISVLLISSITVFATSCKKNKTEEAVASSLVLVSGEGQTAIWNNPLSNKIEVIVNDQNGNAFSGITVNFSVTEGSVSSVTTNAYGRSNATWTLGSSVGTQTLTVTAFKTDGTTHLNGSPLTVNATAANMTVTDYDNNEYQTVKIGNKIWMAENLKVTNYSDGTAIPNITDNALWTSLGDNNTHKAYCFYDNNVDSEYGALYTWAGAMNGANSDISNPSTVQGVCPVGWHLPSDSEWNEMVNYLGGITIAGGKLKEEGTIHWSSPNEGATNETGFTGLPGGARNQTGGFEGETSMGLWWSSTESTNTFAVLHLLRVTNTQVPYIGINKSNGISVRCVLD